MTQLVRLPEQAEIPRWNAEADPLECVAVLPETENVRTFCFQAPNRGWFRYHPGQFVTLEVPVGPTPVYRTYTLSSSPSRPFLLMVTVKVNEGSLAGRWLFENMEAGKTLRASPPAGIFTCDLYPADKYLFISAGSGITPMMSMTRWFYDTGRCSDVTFINAARRPSQIIFRDELERMAARVPDFRLGWVVSENDPYKVWTGYRGRLNGLMLELMAPDYFEREIFCCGPEGFMQSVRDVLNLAGFDMTRYHEESFHAPITDPAAAPEPDDVIPDESLTARIIFARSGVEARCRQTDTILSVAKEAGLNIPSGCQFGVCGTCKIRRLSGETHMVHNGGIRDEEAEDGYVLACCTSPLGRVELDI